MSVLIWFVAGWLFGSIGTLFALALVRTGTYDVCDTCEGTGRWVTTFEDAPTTLVDIGECPECRL